MVCAGNICRSPMAEALLAERLRRRGISTIVESAGITALVGHPADAAAEELMRERGLDLSGHRGRQLTTDLVRSFDLVLVMEKTQQRIVETEYPAARGRVRRLGEIRGFDVPDPYRRGRPAFEHALELIDRGILDLEKAFWSKP